ncbi:TonB-dependent receptor [Microbulbifer agarilyticus]|uniref:TonB-dependent receptor n=1 Tax=Microbulbifer agarilyticus TaxID=260552 RepID=UPI001CD1BDEF|nr:TonB-dependent receptor [Microbulbifer agarilyticus]MCA0892158.1 TonB-dependent receptor [Microbulbifer agarilyticus]
MSNGNVRRFRRAGVGGFALSTLVLACGAVADENGEYGLEEVTVTAQKREASIQDVPVSVSATTGQALEDAGLSDMSALGELIPTLNINSSDEDRVSTVTIRGIGSSQTASGIEPSTSIMYDGEVFARSAAINGDLADIERVEVLRGPQGTLFGKNSSTGVIHFVTKRPDFEETGGYVSVQAGEYGQSLTKAAVTGPINDKFAYRINAYNKQSDGHVENAGGDNLGKLDANGVRAQLAWNPTDNTELLFRVDHSKKDSTGGAVVLLQRPDKDREITNAGLLSLIDEFGLDTQWGTNTANYDLNSKWSTLESTGFSMEATVDLNDHRLVYQAFTRDWELNESTSVDLTPVQLESVVFGGPNIFDTQQHELRIESPSYDKWDYLAGVFYYKQDSERLGANDRCKNIVHAGTSWDPETYELTSCADSQVLDFTFDTSIDLTNIGAYAHVNFRPTDNSTLFAGLRHVYEESTIDYEGGAKALPYTVHDTDDTALIYKFGGQYNLTDEAMVYASFTTGYKGRAWYNSGGVSADDLAAVLDPEESTQAEIGIKSDWLDNRLRLNASLFSLEIEGFQERVQEFDEGIGSYVNRYINSGTVKTEGVELDAEWAALENLTLKSSIVYMDARYEEMGDNVIACPVSTFAACENNKLNIEGMPMLNAPELSYNIQGKYWFELPGNNEGFVALNYRWKDEENFDFKHHPAYTHPAYGLLNLSAGIDLAESKYQLRLFGKNLTDEVHYGGLKNKGVHGGGMFANVPVNFERTFGASVRVSF